MNDEEQQDPISSQDRKGKRRAIILDESTERTPLLEQLAGTSQLPWQGVNETDEATRLSSRRRLCAKLTKVFLLSLLVSILFLVVIGLLAWSYAARATGLTPQDIINKHLVFLGPDKLEIINVTADGGLWVKVEGRLGVDIGDALGINSGSDDGILERVWKGIGRHGVQTLENVSLNLTTVSVLPEFDPYQVLANIDIPPLQVPLSVNPPDDNTWLTPITVSALVHPTTNTSIVASFLRDSWKRGFFAVRADVKSVYVLGGSWNRPSWRTRFHGKLSNIQASLRLQVPAIPGLPHPGADVPLPTVAELISLKSFSLYSARSQLNLIAEASVIDPVPSGLNFTSPPLQFTASLPTTSHSTIDIASVIAAPFSLTHPNITIQLEGSVLPIESAALPTLSSFLMRYLSGKSNPIVISSKLLPGLAIQADFPAPNPRPHILQNVTIHDMKLKPKGSNGQFFASGTVFARIVLPKGMDVTLDVSKVLPDVLIFDGEVPVNFSWTPPAPPEPPLPDPLPERAFGHIRPEDWLNATSVRDPSGVDEGSAYAVTAKVVDVPLEVLPGRQKEFSNFVSKVIFNSDGAVAGLQGVAAVSVSVEGLPVDGRESELSLQGLPFRGSVKINKKSLLKDQVKQWRHILDSLPFITASRRSSQQ
ncbi:hypothetical protein D9611_012056 [Ephemerocybe angulata]|uniref:Uncharacterized protein n=1 Tax=Ephemerocybe angulata TaxID=980116 RepID=A0A8H5ASZ2_9AGAR|nr:hypothetical protein D9611_012056 [Tulosesus angulatus]